MNPFQQVSTIHPHIIYTTNNYALGVVTPTYAVCLVSQIFSLNISVESNYETRSLGNILRDGWKAPSDMWNMYGLYENISKSYSFPNVLTQERDRNNFKAS